MQSLLDLQKLLLKMVFLYLGFMCCLNIYLSPFVIGVFKLVLSFDEEYPTKPPKVKFVSKIFHPNGKFFLASFTNAAVYNDGNICLDILNTRWTPTYDVAAILTSIQSLLHDPNPESPANAQAANFYKNDRKEYEKLVRATVEASWRDD